MPCAWSGPPDSPDGDSQMTKRALLLLITVALSTATWAAPSIVSDATTTTTVTHCAWYLDSAARELVVAPKDSQGRPYCSKDVGAIATGAHSVQAAFVIQDATWGEQEGPKSDPFAFTRPAAPSRPSGLKVVAQ